MALGTSWDSIWRENEYSLYNCPDRNTLIRLILTHGFEIHPGPRFQLTFMKSGLFIATVQYQHRLGKSDDVFLRINAHNMVLDQVGKMLQNIIDHRIPGKEHLRDFNKYQKELHKHYLMP